MEKCSAAVVLLCVVGGVNAEPNRPATTNVSVQLENDALTLATHDRWYTNGLKVDWITNESSPPNWLVFAGRLVPWFEAKSPGWWGWSLQQRIFTPEDISEPQFPPEDRPYAGWLNLNFSLANRRSNYLERLHLGIGITGEASLAEQVQELSHKLIGTSEAVGWDTQLPTEPTLMLVYDRQWQLGDRYYGSGFRSDWAPHVGFSLGNAITQAETSVFWRFGRDLPDDFGPPHISALPNGAAYFQPQAQTGWYFCLGLGVRMVAHNLFLDGTTFEDSPSVESKTFVGEAFAGYVHYWGDFRLSYVYARRSEEFENQDEPQNLAAISLTWNVGE